MKKINSCKITIPAKSVNEGYARAAVAAFAALADPTLEELSDIRTAVSEAVTNCIVHAYKGREDGQIYINVWCYEGRRVVIRVRDKGCGMADPEKCRMPLFTTDPSGERGGMGFAIMESFTDKMKLKTEVGRGTTVTLIKKLI